MNPKELVMSKIWNQWKQILLAAALLSASAWVASQPEQTQAQPAAAPLDIPGEGTVDQPLGSPYAAPKKLSPKAVRVTLYRPATDTGKGVAHLSVNGQYHTSLQRGAFSEICVEPREFSLAAHIVESGQDTVNAESSLSFKPKVANDFYVRLQGDSANTTVITPVADTVARKELQSTRRQIHVASRVADATECVEPVVVAPEPVVAPVVLKTENITLASDALFGFGKSDIKGISDEGRAALDALIAKLKQQHGNFDKTRVHIVGHADPLGNPDSNQRLSAARANTIRAYLAQGGISANKLSSEGRGDTEPVIDTCARTINPENIACNKPNRRVVVVVQQLDR